MFKRHEKMATLVMVLILTLVLASCASTPTSTSTSPAATTTPVPDEPVTLTIWAMAFEKSFPAGVQDDPVAQEITKKTGVIMDITPANAVSDYNSKLAAALAASDLPDIAFVQDAAMLPKIISSKAALAFDPYLEMYGKDILTETPFRVEYARKFTSKDIDGKSDGKMYFWTTIGDEDIDPLQVQVAPYLRYDLWKQLGYPKLETMDDYIPVLKSMLELEPTNVDDKPNYGVSAWFGDAAGWNNWPLNAVFGMIEGYSSFGAQGSFDMKSNEITSKVLNPDSFYWHALSWFNKANLAGILDPEAPTMKWDNFLEKMAAHRIFFGYSFWSVDGANLAFSSADQPLKGFVQMQPPTKRDAYMVSFSSPQGANNMFISAKTKYPEKCVTFLNYLTSFEGTETIFNGVEGIHWDIVDGKPVLRAETLKEAVEDPDYRIKSGYYKYHNLAGRGLGAIDPKFNAPASFKLQPAIVEQRMTPLMKDFADHMKIQFPGDLYMKNPAIKYTSYDTSLLAVLPTQPDNMKELETKLNNYILANEIKLVLAKSEAEFETMKAKFIADCKELGAEENIQWYKDAYAQIHG